MTGKPQALFQAVRGHPQRWRPEPPERLYVRHGPGSGWVSVTTASHQPPPARPAPPRLHCVKSALRVAAGGWQVVVLRRSEAAHCFSNRELKSAGRCLRCGALSHRAARCPLPRVAAAPAGEGAAATE